MSRDWWKNRVKELSIDELGCAVCASRRADHADRSREICTGVSTDSRTAGAGDCFFALVGQTFDGHDHVAQAFAMGAACAVVSRDVAGLAKPHPPLLRVPDTVKALGDLGRYYRKLLPFKLVAITGSVGKTTTRQIVHHVLSQRFAVHQAQKSFNNAIGVPMTILGAGSEDRIIVAELGSNHPGEIGYLTRIALPDIAVVTNTHPAHLEGFGDLGGIIREKVSIAEGLPPDGVFIINGDIEPLVAACRRTGRAFRTFGRSADADYHAEQVVHEPLASTFAIQDHRIRLPLPGPGNVDNALAAWAVSDTLGLTIDEFTKTLTSLAQVAMRAESLQIGSLTVLNDCYNANPASMTNALAMLRNLRGAGNRRLVFICGHMAELGAQSESLHAELGEAVARAGVDLLLTVGAPARIVGEAARAHAGNGFQVEHCADTSALCNNLQKWLHQDDIILVKGSRAARLETVVAKLREAG
jgi:UDP-N-acetylmuramoyl-tripeptide--D-alanyl-D-alanine ligase